MLAETLGERSLSYCEGRAGGSVGQLGLDAVDQSPQRAVERRMRPYAAITHPPFVVFWGDGAMMSWTNTPNCGGRLT